jgi:hypothetical protein
MWVLFFNSRFLLLAIALACQIKVSGDAHNVQPGDPVRAALSLQRRVDLDISQGEARISGVVALEDLPPGYEVSRPRFSGAVAKLHRQYALPTRAGDEISLARHLVRSGGKAEVLLEVEGLCLSCIQALAFDGQIVLWNFGVNQYVHELGGEARLLEPVGYGCDAILLEERVEGIDQRPLEVAHCVLFYADL